MRILRHDEVDSTNERALAAIAAGTARHHDLLVARAQSAGRGRLGRAWHSPAGEGLYLSLVLLPETAPEPTALTMGAGLAVIEALAALGARDLDLKWPNDVLHGTAKLAGILVESRGLGVRAAGPAFVAGVGVNVRQREFPAALEAERAVTSLARLGLDLEPEAVLAELAPRLVRRLDRAGVAPEGVARDYAARLGLLGRAVRVRTPRAELEGTLEALSIAAGLVLARAGRERARLELAHVTRLEAVGGERQASL